ncbi:similar to tRNA isopentenyltransferase [Plenodomus lingam JN3]|uniref:tRNA dimethylallyltransferase n=2 Tax=Leptosphaeria maculans TaxID=5022 RepID=E5A4N0_LEPMJ|nr:similar to tRNA isopentenyltransferase [Plenodomus lingam JN3]CBX98578.1 similar to tRNA isopentenyltransferase [Plenodomus lingam JN3]
MARAPVKPLITIVGATGTGKSDLAVEIARRLDGEIINGDAMQLYRGLPIITNKITSEEAKGVPHHLLGCIGLEEETWTVGKFVGEGLRIIDEIQSRRKLPILVGGTHYYTQSLLFQDALTDEPTLDLHEDNQKFPILQEPTATIHAKLREVDPVMADRWHPNERRKIQRSLEIFLRTGKPASQLYSEQRSLRASSSKTIGEDSIKDRSSLRFPTLVIWVHANKAVLYPRLDARVDKMLQRGLLDEVQQLSDYREREMSRSNSSIDTSRGIWVSIGYKEFLEYQNARTNQATFESELAKQKHIAIEKTQAATRQYANRQIKWIRIKLLNALIHADAKNTTFLVDGSDLSRWEEDVVQPAVTITQQFLSGQSLPVPIALSPVAADMLTPTRDYDLAQRPDLWERKVCDTCGTIAVTENDWTLHTRSRAHRKAVGAKKKQAYTQRAQIEERKGAQKDVIDVLENYLGSFQDKEDHNRT